MFTRLHPFFKQPIIISVAPSWSPLPATRSSLPFSGRKNSNVHSLFILFYFLPASRFSAGTEIRGPLHRCERAPCKTRLARMEKRQGPTPSRPAEPCLSLLTICQVSVSFGIRPVSAIGSRTFQSLLFGIPYQCQRSRPDRGVPRLMPCRCQSSLLTQIHCFRFSCNRNRPCDPVIMTLHLKHAKGLPLPVVRVLAL